MLCCADIDQTVLSALLNRFRLRFEMHAPDEVIEGSFWGEPEAGLVGRRVMVRPDTPVHSVLHESCHFVCMDESCRSRVHTDAGGGYDEENAVCFLQILLADHVPEMGRKRMCADMDAWGYTFRLGSAARWFKRDADDARQWLLGRNLIDANANPTWRNNGE